MDESRAQALRGNQVLALDRPGAAWLVERGGVALFAVASDDGSTDGPRRYLFSCGPGDLLLGMPSRAENGLPVVIAVALQETTLRPLDRREAEAALADPGGNVERWLDGWTQSVGPRDSPAEGPETGIAAGMTFERMRERHLELLRAVTRLERDEQRVERERLLARDRQSREATGEALGALASVLQPGARPLPRGSELFVAACVVGRAQGVSIVPPAAWEQTRQLAEPVEMIARASHVRERKVMLDDGWWSQDCGPMLGFLDDEQRPVALLPVSLSSYELFDPVSGERSAVDADLASRLDAHAYRFYRPLPEDPTRGIALLRFALSGRAVDLLTIIATGVGATLLGMLVPQATVVLVDQIIPDSQGVLLWQIGLALAAAAIGSAVFQLAQGIAMMRVETAADVASQTAVWDRLLNLQLSFFRKFSTGDLHQRVGAIGLIRDYLGGTTLRTLFSSLILLLNLGLLLYYSPSLTLIALAVAAASAAVSVGCGMSALRCTHKLMEIRGRFFGFMVQLVNGVAKLRVAAAEERAFSRWASEYAELLRLELRRTRIYDALHVANIALSTLSAIALFSIATNLVLAPGPGLTTGVFLAFFVAYGTFIGAVVSLSDTVTDVMMLSVLRERARPILEAVPEVNEQKGDPGPLRGRIDIENLVFQYTHEGPIILDEISIRVRPGQFVALVGPSGSGKSTLLRLLLGFETPKSGSVYLDGQELSGLDVHAIRRQMGVVLQTGRINAGSLFENIACSARITLNDAWEAARSTGFADDISAMPMGMHTVVSEGGTNLSGGQRQRLLLSRALVQTPRILLLDEATSALDNETQAIVSASLERLKISRVVIAHRLSTIRNADWIYVVDRGRIVQQGTFDDLSRQTGLFARLMARQMA